MPVLQKMRHTNVVSNGIFFPLVYARKHLVHFELKMASDTMYM